MASRGTVIEFKQKTPGGKYIVLYDFDGDPANSQQLSVKKEEYVEVVEQELEEWTWVRSIEKNKAGYVPTNYVEKVPDGIYDNWAYGAEVTACFYAFFSGMFVLLYGSTMKTDPAIDLGMGSMAMMGASALMLMVFFRDSFSPLARAGCIFLVSIPLAVGYPIGIFGACVLWFSTGVEVVMYHMGDTTYKPPAWRCGECCKAMWGANAISIFFFLLWCAANFAVFMLGLWHGQSRVEDWQNDEEEYQMETGEWSFTQACGAMICFCMCTMLIFSLQGFQSVLVAIIDFRTAKVGKWADFKKTLSDAFSRESMIRVHKWIAWTMVLATLFHVFGAFASYEHSGPRKDFDRIFGEAPLITGGMNLVVLAIILSSVFITPDHAPTLFRNIHFFGILFIVLLVFHGKSFWGPNFWKWMLGPFLLFLMDKAFRYGLLMFDGDQPPETME